MATKLWDIENFITGYVVAQSLVLIYAMAKGDLARSLQGGYHVYAIAGALFTGLVSIYMIRYCHQKGSQWYHDEVQHSERGSTQGQVVPTDVEKVWSRVTAGRIICVALFSLVLVGVIMGHWHHPPKPCQ